MRKLNHWKRAALLLSFFFLTLHARVNLLYATTDDTKAQKNDTTLRSRSIPPESIFNQPYVTTPDMAALARNAAYPINYSTGTPQISIPLYTIQCGNLTLPLTLTYNASGVKVDDVSGMVGQGWTLTGIPAISRHQQGHFDHQYECNFQTYGTRAYDYVERLLDGSNPWSSNDELPDEYYYQLANKSGMFLYVMEQNGAGLSYASLPYNDVKITLTDATYKYFTLTDNDGTIYKFNGGTDYAPIAGGIGESGWKASCMISANSLDSIRFYYDNTASFTLKQNNDSYTIVDDFSSDGVNRWPRIDLYTNYNMIGQLSEGTETEEVMKAPIVYKTTGDYRYSYQVNDNGNLYSDNQPVLSPLGFQSYVVTRAAIPQMITYKGNTITFEVTGVNRHNKISSIIVKNAQNQVVRHIKLDYHYNSYRCFLMSVSFMDSSGDEVLEKYTFEYEKPDNLPDSGSRAIDFWGYYNGGNKQDGGTLVPKMVLTSSIDYSGYHSPQYYNGTVKIGATGWFSRASDEQYMVYGTLKSITYPTGAKDEFTFEANQVKFSGDSIESDFYITDHLLPVPDKSNTYYVGGLRIKQIKSIVNSDSVNYRTFQYNTDGTGTSPIDKSTNYFVSEKRKYYYVSWREPHVPAIVSSRYRVASSSPILPLTFSNGAVVMYSEVTEYNGKSASDNNGKTVYKYSVPNYKWTPIDFYTKLAYKYKDWEYGHLTQKTVYRGNSNSYSEVIKEDYSYALGCKVGKVWAGEYTLTSFTNYYGSSIIPYPQGTLQYMGGTYGYDVWSYNLTGKTTTIYGDNGYSLVSQEGYTRSIPYCTLVTEKSSTRYGETYTESYQYPYHFGSTAPYNTMLTKNVLNPVITTTSTRNGHTIVSKYPYVANYFKPSALQMNFNGEGLAERITYSYDNKGNKVQASKDGRENVVFLYGYDSQYIVAVIENATYSEVLTVLGNNQIASIRDNSQPSESQWTLLDGLRNNTSHKDWHVTTYKYKPLVGVCKMTDPAGQIFTYEYDDLGRLISKNQYINNSEITLESYDYHYKE